MGNKQSGTGGQGDTAKTLRKRAEEKVRSGEHFDLGEPPPGEARAMYQMLHELRVHQAELEMQNDELRQAQVELEAARTKYFDLYNLAPVGYFTISGQGVILEANLTAANLLGMERNRLVDQPFTRLIVPDDQDIYYLSRKKLLETGTPHTCEVRMTRPDGALLWARLEMAVATDAAGGEQVCNAMMNDITGRKRADLRLRLLQNAMEQADETVIITDADGIIEYANPAVAKKSGYPVAFLLGKKNGLFKSGLLRATLAHHQIRPRLEREHHQPQEGRFPVRGGNDHLSHRGRGWRYRELHRGST